MVWLRSIIRHGIILLPVLGPAPFLVGCGSKEPTEQAKIDAKKEADAQLERAAELYRKKQQAGQVP
jgi:hypothetical protein